MTGVVAYINFFKKTEVWKLVLASLVFQFFESALLYCNIKRYNVVYWGISDLPLNMFSNLIGKATLICLGILPMTIMLMQVVPKNIEASCFAVITGILTLSTECSADIVGALFCDAFGITVKDMTNYH